MTNKQCNKRTKILEFRKCLRSIKLNTRGKKRIAKEIRVLYRWKGRFKYYLIFKKGTITSARALRSILIEVLSLELKRG